MPHPLEPYMNLRVKTREEPALEVTRESVTNLSNALDVILAAFEAEVQRAQAQ